MSNTISNSVSLIHGGGSTGHIPNIVGHGIIILSIVSFLGTRWIARAKNLKTFYTLITFAIIALITSTTSGLIISLISKDSSVIFSIIIIFTLALMVIGLPSQIMSGWIIKTKELGEIANFVIFVVSAIAIWNAVEYIVTH